VVGATDADKIDFFCSTSVRETFPTTVIACKTRTREAHQTGATSRVRANRSACGIRKLPIRAEEEVVGSVRHEGLLSHIAGNSAAGCRSRSAVGVEALDKGRLGEQSAAGRSLLLADDLQQDTGNRAGIRATRFGTGCDKMLGLRPNFAAIERTLPGHVAEGQRAGSELVRTCVGAQEMSDDLLRLSEKIREKGGFGPSIVDCPGSARA
jgi:hypothetical protein